jgi:acyl-coenzyme A thioesterase PaaI-like protein
MTSPSSDHLDLCVRTTLALPSAAACKLRVVEQPPGRAVCRLDVTEGVCGGTGALSGGDLYGLLDSIAYLGLITLLPDDETGVSHDAHFSLVSMAPLGTEVEIRSVVQKRGRNVAFIRVEAFVLGAGEPKLLALATVTKSIISMKQRLRHKPAE